MAGAFWRIGFTQSNIDSILDKEGFTLQELLDDDDILQECRQANKKLTEYLAEPSVIKTLLDYVVNEPSEDVDERERFKYPNIASEVLTSECWPIMDAICQPEALEMLWGTLDKPQPLNPLLASFFTKVLIMLLHKEVELITKYIIERPDITDKLISHLATPAIMDVILKMTTVETGGDGDNDTTLSKFWAEDSKLASILIGLFDTAKSGASDAVIGNAAILIEDLVTGGRKEAIEMQEFSTPSPFLAQLTSEPILSELLRYMFDEKTSPVALQSGLDVINVLLTEPERGEEEAPPTEMDNMRHKQETSQVLRALTPFVGKLHGLLLIEPPTIATASGVLKHPLGSSRLNATRTVEALVIAKDDAVDAEIAELKTLEKLWELLSIYPDNNFLHAHMSNIVQHILANPPSDASKSLLHNVLFTECNLLTKLMGLFRDGVAPLDTPTAARKGYMGHIIQMANFVNQVKDVNGNAIILYCSEGASEDAQAVGAQWKEFSANELAQANATASSSFAERPSMNSFDSDDDDDDDDYLTQGEDAQSVQNKFQQYLNERIAFDIPDDYGIDDDDDDDDAYDNLANTYGTQGVFGDNLAYSLDSPKQGDADKWQIVDAAGNPLGHDPSTTVVIKDVEDDVKSKPSPVDLSTAPQPQLSGDPQAASTPLDAPATGWADFDSAPSAQTDKGWADFGATQTVASTTAANPDVGEAPQRQNTPQYTGVDSYFEPGISTVPAVSSIGEQDESSVNEDDDDDEELPSLPPDAADEELSSATATLTLDGNDGGDGVGSSSDPASSDVVQDIEGGGALFSSAV